MKINEHVGVGGPNRSGDLHGIRNAVKGDRGKSDGGRDGDKISVSEDARRLSRLKHEAGDDDAARVEKVEALRGQIERGDYEVDLKAVARKFLESLFGG